MELRDAVRRRRMVRAFTDAPVEPEVVEGLIDLARRAPSAGNSQGVAWVVLSGPEETARYWDVALPEGKREGFGFPGLVSAPVLVLALVRAGTWIERYAEPDKAAHGLGRDEAAWPVPYWWVDGGMAVEHVLLGAVDVGLGACFFGLFDHEPAVFAALGVPDGWRALGTIALGHPAPDEPGLSAKRPRRTVDEVLHRGSW
ncbi:MAG: nitroreductase family protein [Acidimicrobiales bacterium]